jgi:MSHA biogenesis protein MshJ
MKPAFKIPPAVQRFGARIDAMTLRERAILFALVLGGLFLLADQVLFPSLSRQQKQLEKQIGEQLAQLNTINDQINRIVTDSTQDPDAVLRTRLEGLQKQFAELDLAAADITRGLVSPREMTRLVHAMLRENRALELVSAVNLPPEAIPLQAGDKPAAGNVPSAYRHGLRIAVKGRYPDIVRYLRSLEKLTWRVMWGEVQLDSEHYPVSRVTVTLYTLSLDKAWIGV